MTRGDHARPGNPALVDRVHQRDVREAEAGAEIAHRREAREQRFLRVRNGAQGKVAGREAHRLSLPSFADDVVEVHVRVHEAGQQGMSGKRNRLRADGARAGLTATIFSPSTTMTAGDTSLPATTSR